MNPNNFLNDGAKSSAEAYYDYQLRKEKLKGIADNAETAKWLSAEEKSALSEISEREKLELKILSRLMSLTDSSAELLQVKALTDCKTREECAKSLAETYLRKFEVESVLNRFVSPKTSKEILSAGREKSAKAYQVWGSESS